MNWQLKLTMFIPEHNECLKKTSNWKKNELECVVFPKQEPTNTPSFIPFPHARIGTCIEEKMPLGSTLTTLKCRVHDNLDAEMCSTYASFVDRHEFVFDSGLKMLWYIGQLSRQGYVFIEISKQITPPFLSSSLNLTSQRNSFWTLVRFNTNCSFLTISHPNTSDGARARNVMWKQDSYSDEKVPCVTATVFITCTSHDWGEGAKRW